jgi:hypothetical protein
VVVDCWRTVVALTGPRQNWAGRQPQSTTPQTYPNPNIHRTLVTPLARIALKPSQHPHDLGSPQNLTTRPDSA